MKMEIRANAEVAEAPVGDENLSGYTYAIAFLHFGALALGYMSVTILSKVEGGERGLSEIADYLAGAELWVFLVPLVWWLATTTVMEVCPPRLARQIVNWTGGVRPFVSSRSWSLRCSDCGGPFGHPGYLIGRPAPLPSWDRRSRAIPFPGRLIAHVGCDGDRDGKAVGQPDQDDRFALAGAEACGVDTEGEDRRRVV